jgi:hypothetical protein
MPWILPTCQGLVIDERGFGLVVSFDFFLLVCLEGVIVIRKIRYSILISNCPWTQKDSSDAALVEKRLNGS